MESTNNHIKVDGFRFINNLHTTARQLFVCTKITDFLSNKQLPKKLLGELLFKWSFEEEEKNTSYKKSKGKLTKNGKETTSLLKPL